MNYLALFGFALGLFIGALVVWQRDAAAWDELYDDAWANGRAQGFWDAKKLADTRRERA